MVCCNNVSQLAAIDKWCMHKVDMLKDSCTNCAVRKCYDGGLKAESSLVRDWLGVKPSVNMLIRCQQDWHPVMKPASKLACSTL